MGFDAFSSDSKSNQKTVSVGGSGQYIEKPAAGVAQGGGVLFGKSANLGGANIKTKGNVTVNNTGASTADLKSLLGEITAATPQQVQQASSPPVTDQAAATDDTKSKYITWGLSLAAAISVGLIARGLFRKS